MNYLQLHEAKLQAGKTVGANRCPEKVSRANPVTFILPVDAHYRLTADALSWRVEQCREDGEWRPIEWHATIEHAVNSLASRRVRTSEVRTLADALAAVENVVRTLTRALAPRFEVKQRLQ